MITEQDKQKAAEIVKRCGLRDGLFKGPRTLNVVETMAYALAAERERCAVIACSLGCKAKCDRVVAAAIRGISDER